MSDQTHSFRKMSQRDLRVEVLRLVAVLGIAVFHSFMSSFAGVQDGWLVASAPLAWGLGCVNLLGSYGNHVFYMVSGFFLLPRCVGAARVGAPWQAQLKSTARRVATVLASVIFWAAAALAVDRWVVPVPGVSVHKTAWLVGGLEFIWVYLALIALAPLIGRLAAPLHRSRRRAILAALVMVVFALNAYIAFFSPGDADRGLLEWRKLMSAASYLMAFLAGAELSTLPARRSGAALALALAVTCLVEGYAAATGDIALMAALSYKSTSALSFAAAACSVAFATRRLRHPVPEGSAGPKSAGATVAPAPGLSGDASDPAGFSPAVDAPKDEKSPVARAVRWLTPSILGFYIAQSMFWGVWLPAIEDALLRALDLGEAAFFATGVLLSALFLLVLLIIDRLTRVYLLKLCKLA